MPDFELLMPKMGESIMEATILKWLKQVGDRVEEDETLLEIATDKVDTEIPSPVPGKIKELRFGEDAVVKVGEVIAVIDTSKKVSGKAKSSKSDQKKKENGVKKSTDQPKATQPTVPPVEPKTEVSSTTSVSSSERFYSPLVRNIATKEGISQSELDAIPGSGLDSRVTKRDVMAYLNSRSQIHDGGDAVPPFLKEVNLPEVPPSVEPISIAAGSGDEILEMDRMRTLIAKHMVASKQTSPHVTSFVEADVTNLVEWRTRNKEIFLTKYATKLTYTPVFIQAICRAIHDFPMINVSLQGNHIIVKKALNIGMATALPTGNLIVPVIKNADSFNLAGLAKQVNTLAEQARENRLDPSDIQDGTFTLTNVGTFGNVMGTPIINQPQAAIMAAGAIRKKPAVIETEFGDLIAVRQMMFLSLSYDHRIIDGFLGGSFLRRVADYLEQFEEDDIV
ncbi:MAG: 2-oxo acid dehydrogenase subunit E2 [Saprospiraceae bacterium]|nr:2-oxo acid dehydrogenase subunit E2 [Saprospiraceae bacterium]